MYISYTVMTNYKTTFQKTNKIVFLSLFLENKSEFQNTIFNVKFARRNDLRPNDNFIYFVYYFLLLAMYIILCMSVPNGFSKLFYKLQ